MDSERTEHVRRVGRRLGISLFGLVVSGFVIVCSAQILYQGFNEPNVVATGDCRALIAKLAASVNAARDVAGKITDERSALHAFRSALEPQWRTRSSLSQLCAGDQWALNAVSAVDEWRWAEESAIRYEAVDLAPTRRRAQQIAKKLARPIEH